MNCDQDSNGSSDSELSIEYGRGGTFARAFLEFAEGGGFFENVPGGAAHLPVAEREAAPRQPPTDFPALQESRLPLSVRRQMPGSGINHFDIFDEPIRCEVPPFSPKPATFEHSEIEDLFDQFENDLKLETVLGHQKFVKEHFQRKQYGRSQRRQPPSRPPWNLAGFFGQGPSRNFPVSDPRHPLFLAQLSPLSTSSSSSSSSSSPSSFGDFHPNFQSTMIRTPSPRPRLQPRLHRPLPIIHESEFTPPASNGSPASSNSGEYNSNEEQQYLPESPLPGCGSFPRSPFQNQNSGFAITEL